MICVAEIQLTLFCKLNSLEITACRSQHVPQCEQNSYQLNDEICLDGNIETSNYICFDFS